MKKIILSLCVLSSALFAAMQPGCVETKLNEVKSLYDCAHATFEVTFEFDRHTKKKITKR